MTFSLQNWPNAEVFIIGGGGSFCWNADGCRLEGGRGQKSRKFADVLNGWSQSILTRKQLKEIELSVYFHSNFNYENVFPKNLSVDEIFLNVPFFGHLASEIWIKVFDALPNIKTVRVGGSFGSNNVVMILKKLIRAFKGLKSLHYVCFEKLGSHQLNDCYNFIKENFPLKSKVIILAANEPSHFGVNEGDVLTYQIIKEEGKPPQIVNSGSPGSIITWTDHEYEKFKRL